MEIIRADKNFHKILNLSKIIAVKVFLSIDE